MKRLGRSLLRGLVVVGPIGLTIYIVVWVVKFLDDILGNLLRSIMPEFYVTGMGLLLAVVLVLLIGMLLDSVVVRMLVGGAEDMLERLPLVKTVYGSLRDLAGFFSHSRQAQGARQVVLIHLPGSGMKLLGLVTRDDLTDLPPQFGAPDHVAVYIPLSYAWGGYTTLVPRSAIEKVDMTVEAALRFAVTAGMSVGNDANPTPTNESPQSNATGSKLPS